MKKNYMHLLIYLILVSVLISSTISCNGTNNNSQPSKISIKNTTEAATTTSNPKATTIISASYPRDYFTIRELLEVDAMSLIVTGVIGKVTNINEEELLTDYNFTIDDIIWGNEKREITVRGFGIPDGAQMIESPLPETGERYLLVLLRARAVDKYVYSMWPWGTFKIIDNKVYSMPLSIEAIDEGLPFEDGMSLDLFIERTNKVTTTLPVQKKPSVRWANYLDEFQLYDYSDLIVTGTFDSIIDTIQSEEGPYYTRFVFTVENSIKGEAENNITIEHTGDPEQPDTLIKYDSMPQIGERYILFLKWCQITDDYYYSIMGRDGRFKVLEDKVYSMNYFSDGSHFSPVYDTPGIALNLFINQINNLADTNNRQKTKYSTNMESLVGESNLIISGTIAQDIEIEFEENGLEYSGITFEVDQVLKGNADGDIVLIKSDNWNLFERDTQYTTFDEYFKVGDSYILALHDFIVDDEQILWFWPNTELEVFKINDGKVYSLNYIMEDRVSALGLDFNGVPLDEFKQMLEEEASD